ncbi:MAG: hypothetical protein AAFY72_05730 [Cyanobacteria bacterium J06649_4]
MRTQTLLTTATLIAVLTACASAPIANDSLVRSSDRSSGLSSKTSSSVNCELTQTAELEPLSNSENTPVFEQFNFQPQEIAIANNTVTLTTPHHIFSLCKSNGTWSIASATAAEDVEPYDYEQSLRDLADPAYDTITLNKETYEYRIRLQAEWLSEQLKPETTDPEAPEPETTVEVAPEDAVFFELKEPDGDIVSHLLYTLSDLQSAQLGASLGVPNIAGAVATGSEIWFAATASQGEGDSGFASLIHFEPATGSITVDQPDSLQGDQLTSLIATGNIAAEQQTETNQNAQTTPNDTLTLWLGTQRSGEGVPYFPASGLVAYRPSDKSTTSYTHKNSPLIGAIPSQLALEEDTLWVGTRNGICSVDWQTIEENNSWNCWQFSATATLPDKGIDLYKSFLADEPTTRLKTDSVEVLWVNRAFDALGEEQAVRYEVVYKPGFETTLPQGGYRVSNEVAQRAAGGNEIFWPGRQWHWRGDRFVRSLDEVALNLVGGGPYGLVDSYSGRTGFDVDNNAIRGDFDLIELTSETTKVRYYSGWIEGSGIEVYPMVVPVERQRRVQPNPLTTMAANLTATQGP